MEQSKKPEMWSDLKLLREEKGISLQHLSDLMRLPVERIQFLEDGDFTNDDPIITRLQLKNYARYLNLKYEDIIAISSLSIPTTDFVAEPLGESIKIKKTRSYRGRKKEPKKWLVYTFVILGSLIALFILNKLASNLSISTDVFEMTEQQVNALNTPSEEKNDTLVFKPVLPQMNKEEVITDITAEMLEYHRNQISFPLIINVFPRDNISYRYITANSNPTEDFIMMDKPKSFTLMRPCRLIFYNIQNSRFVTPSLAFREKNISTIVIDINEDREMIIFTK
jgi:hypothetical protein